MLLDEPTNDLDLHYQIAILDHLARLVKEQGKTVIAVMHDPNLAARYCDNALLLFGEGETRQGTTQDLLSGETLTRLYRHPIAEVIGEGGRAFIPG